MDYTAQTGRRFNEGRCQWTTSVCTRTAAAEPLRPWLPADLLDNAARTISENKTIMLGLPVLAAIALARRPGRC